jgi:excisionase family DNA binding protein
MEQILTVDEAAEQLKVRPETVRRLLSQGKLPGNKVGRAWRIPEGELLRFLRGEVRIDTADSREPAGVGAIDQPMWIE